MTKSPNRIDKLLIDIILHLEPDCLNEPEKFTTDTKNLDMKKLQKYSDLVWSIQCAFDKTQRYPVYFAEFYTSSKQIPDYEALEHHIHAYLSDITILKNKVEVFLGCFKNDVGKIVSNKEHFLNELQGIIKEVLKSFDNVKEHRDPHYHKGLPYIDGDLLEAKNATSILDNDNPLNKFLSDEGKKSFREKAEKSFKKAKNYRIQQAQKNNEQILGLMDVLFRGLEKGIYAFLGIKNNQENYLKPLNDVSNPL